MLAHAATGALVLRTVFPRAHARRRRELHGWWSAKLVRLLGIAIRVEGPLPADDGVPAIVIANHVSWLDTFLVSTVRPTRFIAKSEIREWPLAGWIAERAGTIFLRRERRFDIARINDVVHAALAEGDTVGFFPEGTTTAGDELLKFHSALFEPAVANEAWVYPVAIRYEHADGSHCRAMAYAGEVTFMQSLGLVIRQHSVVARIAFSTPIAASGMSRRELAQIARERVATLLGLSDSPPGTPPDRRAAPR